MKATRRKKQKISKPVFCRVCKDIKAAEEYLAKGAPSQRNVCKACRTGHKVSHVPVEAELRRCAGKKCETVFTSSHHSKSLCNECIAKKKEADMWKGKIDPKWLTRGKPSLTGARGMISYNN